MRRVRGIAVLLLAASSLDLARSSVSHGRSLEYATDLTAIGPASTGSRTYERAAEWSRIRFRAMGVTRVALEPFTIERGWERVSARARIAAPVDRPLHVESLGWSPSTPEGGFDADVRCARELLARRRARRGRCKAASCCCPKAIRRAILSPPEDDQRVRGQTARAGALAILVADSEADNRLTARGLSFGTALSVLAAGPDRPRRSRGDPRAARARGPVRISLELTNRITPAAAVVNNVIAEIAGRDRPTSGSSSAHIWIPGTSGPAPRTTPRVAAMVLEAAACDRRARTTAAALDPVRALGRRRAGTARFHAYVRAHAAEQDRVVAYLNTDAGTGR
jgi:hypothetical protein